MNEFKTYHPIVNFIYFVFVIGFSCFFMHPVCLGISLVCGLVYSAMLKGKKTIKKSLIFILPVLVLTSLINSAVNHGGVTILGYLPTGNPFTLESVIFGVCAGAMIVSVICHFICYNEVMTSDKFIYLFGKIIPGLSLIISMTLRFVPRFIAQFKAVERAQKCIGRDVSKGNIIKRPKYALGILSVVTTWSLENSIETADSMKGRGYGLPGRTAFSVFTFDKRDKKTLVCILALGTYTLIGYLSGAMHFGYFPALSCAKISPFGISVFVSYLMLCMYPIIIEIKEVAKWRYLMSRI